MKNMNRWGQFICCAFNADPIYKCNLTVLKYFNGIVSLELSYMSYALLGHGELTEERPLFAKEEVFISAVEDCRVRRKSVDVDIHMF